MTRRRTPQDELGENHLNFARRPVLALVLISLFLPPLAAAAAEAFDLDAEDSAAAATEIDNGQNQTPLSGEIELGLGYISRDTARFGIHNGLNEEGVFGIADFELTAVNGEGRHAGYWQLTGQDLWLDSRSFAMENGRQGDYRFTLDYNELPTIRSNTSRTPFVNPGSDHLALPSNWVPATSTTGMTQLLPNLQDVDLDLKRQRLRLGFDKVLPRHWQLKTSYHNETKDGISSLGAVIGNSGGNPRAAILPQPIDYRTQQFDAALSFADGVKFFEIAYYMSAFNQGESSLSWQNPYSAISGWGNNSAAGDASEASVGFPDGEGRLALPPDNQFHQISLLGGSRVGAYSNLSADLAIGHMSQNETFLPYSINPVLTASIGEALPRDSLNGRIDTTLFNLHFSSQPTPRLHWRAAWRYDNRDNKTPRDEYFYIAGDSITQTDAGSALSTLGRHRSNEPYSYREQKISLDANYRIASRTSLDVGVQRRDMDRDYSERQETVEDTIKVGIKSSMGERLTGRFDLSRTRRTGSTYRGDEPFLSSYRPAYTSNPATLGWENHPDLRKYYLADRDRTGATLSANYQLAEAWTASIGANYMEEDYDNSRMGLTNSKMTGYTFDISHTADSENIFYGFYSHDDVDSDQDGRSFSGGASKAIHSANPDRNWFATLNDRTDTLGLGFKRKLSHSLAVGADYIYANARGQVDISTGAALPTAAPLPDTLVRLQSLEIYGDYQLRPTTTLKARYRVEKYQSRDWALDGVAPNNLANVITLGEDSPDYTVHVLLFSVATAF